MKLSAEERILLQKLTKDQLIFLSEIAGSEDYTVFIQIVNYLIEQEKNMFFRDTAYDKEKLSADLAFSRGTIAGITKFVHIIGAAKHELSRRNAR